MRRYSRPDYKVQWTAGEYATAEEADGAAARARQQMTDTFTPHVMTQVDQLRDRGVTGKGIKIAILDTGVSSSPVVVPCILTANSVQLTAELPTPLHSRAPPPPPLHGLNLLFPTAWLSPPRGNNADKFFPCFCRWTTYTQLWEGASAMAS